MAVDWTKTSLGFDFVPTRAHVEATWADGQWGALRLVEDPYVKIHVGATALGYGQAVFEGLKAFACHDGRVRVFRPHENARRMAAGAERLAMPRVPEEMFVDAVRLAVEANKDYVPPLATGGALYVRPCLFGSGPQIALKPAAEYTLVVYVLPVAGGYYGDKAVSAAVEDGFDRAAPLGVGGYKVAGNYAPVMQVNARHYSAGHAITLFLDAREHRWVEEFNSSNFVGVTRAGVYVTPSSPSILPSITNASLMHIARHLGISVEVRPIDFEREAESFTEVGAVGTAVIITPVSCFVRGEREIRIGDGSVPGMGPTLRRLYEHLRGIQTGAVPDAWGWMVDV